MLYPQVMINENIADKFNWKENAAIQAVLQEAENTLQKDGRVLLRASGTEPLIRVMVEGESSETVQHWAHTIADVVRDAAYGAVPSLRA